jgi:hypothetical protein
MDQLQTFHKIMVASCDLKYFTYIISEHIHIHANYFITPFLPSSFHTNIDKRGDTELLVSTIQMNPPTLRQQRQLKFYSQCTCMCILI